MEDGLGRGMGWIVVVNGAELLPGGGGLEVQGELGRVKWALGEGVRDQTGWERFVGP